MRCIPSSHQSWNMFLVWNFGVENLVELQLGSFDTSNYQLPLEREGHGGTLTGPRVGGQARTLDGLGEGAHGSSPAETLFCSVLASIHQCCFLRFISSDI